MKKEGCLHLLKRPSVACRSEIDVRKIFKLEFFEPTKKEVSKESGVEIDDDDFDAEIKDAIAKHTGKGFKRERSSTPDVKGKRVIKEDSDDEKTQDDDEEEEDVKPKARKAKTKAAKKRCVKDSVSTR